MKYQFSLIKEILDERILEAFTNQDKKQIRTIFETIKKDKNLQKLYMIISNLSEPDIKIEDVGVYISENKKLINTINLEHFKPILEKIQDRPYDSPINEQIDNYLFNKPTISNVSVITESYQKIKEHLKQQQEEGGGEASSFEEKINQLAEEDQKFLKSFYKTPKQDHAIFYENLKKDCISLLNEQLEESGEKDETLQIYEAINKIVTSEFNDENYIEKIVKLHSFKKELSS